MTSNYYDVVVLGAGAAGLMCALTAGGRGRRVLLLEKSNKVGKKILMSGGGRCNFTNLYVEPENYISENPHFCKSALSRYTQWDFISLVEQHEIPYEERKHGQLFCEQSARDILQMLLEECEKAGVDVRTNCDSKNMQPVASNDHENAACYTLGVNEETYLCESLVIATGALSIPTLGGSGMGYDIARQSSLAVTDTRAGLVPFMFTDALKPVCERLSGISLAVEVRCSNQVFSEQLLFTHRGISGPAILQISNYWHPGDELLIDLLPGTDAASWLVASKGQTGAVRLRTVLSQKLPKSLVGELEMLWWPDSAHLPLAEISDKVLETIGERINGWMVKPSASEGYRTAEVTLGGVATDGLNPKTMEAKQQPGLYFIGEVVDVSGHLGGFNFQWAWSSGFSAGSVV